MAHFAEINSNNVVQRVLVVPDSQEHRGQDYLANDLMLGGTWIQTSYNNNIRGKFAGVGDTYDQELDIFISAQPYPSWTLDENYVWQPPAPMPVTEDRWTWDEDSLSWVVS